MTKALGSPYDVVGGGRYSPDYLDAAYAHSWAALKPRRCFASRAWRLGAPPHRRPRGARFAPAPDGAARRGDLARSCGERSAMPNRCPLTAISAPGRCGDLDQDLPAVANSSAASLRPPSFFAAASSGLPGAGCAGLRRRRYPPRRRRGRRARDVLVRRASNLQGCIDVFEPPTGPLGAPHRRVKESFDPWGVAQPGWTGGPGGHADLVHSRPAFRPGYRRGRQDPARLRALRLAPRPARPISCSGDEDDLHTRAHLSRIGDMLAAATARYRWSSTSTAACPASPA